MAAPVNKAKFAQDINAPIKAVYGGGLMFSKDNLSNVISVDIVDNGQPFEVTGTVAGTVIRSDGTTVPVNTGAISGNTVSLTLTEACFDVPGQIVVNIIVTNGDVKCCVLRAVYTVVPTETSAVVDPGDILPSIADLIDDIDAAVASIPADYSGLLASIAGTFSASTAYAAGAYVWHDGTLYQFTAAHAAGSWTGSDAKAVTIGGELADLKSAFDNSVYDAKAITFEIGSISNYADASSTKYVRCAYQKVYKGSKINFVGGSTLIRAVAYFYDNTQTPYSTSGDVDIAAGKTVSVFIPIDGYIRIRACWIPQHDMTDTDIAFFNANITYQIQQFNEFDEQINEKIEGQQNQIDLAIPIVKLNSLEIGGISAGADSSDNKKIRTAIYYKVNKGDKIIFKASSNFLYRAVVYYYAENSVDSYIISSSGIDVARNGADVYYVSEYNGYIRFRATEIPAVTITDSILNEFKTLITYQTYTFLSQINSSIDRLDSIAKPYYFVKTINHRGYETAPENTLTAFKLSKEKGFKYVETDVRFTSNGVAVLLHDASINRTARNADGTTISSTVNIIDITYADALTYDFGIYKGAAYAGTTIPTFESFIALCRNIGLIPVIELKAGTEAQIQGLYDVVARYGLQNETMWLSQTYLLLTYIRDYADSATLIRCTATYNEEYTQYLKTAKNKVLVALPSTGIDATVVGSCIENNFELIQYTITTSSEITNANSYVSWFLSNALDAGAVLYNGAI